jgi:hypothetical protein
MLAELICGSLQQVKLLCFSFLRTCSSWLTKLPRLHSIRIRSHCCCPESALPAALDSKAANGVSHTIPTPVPRNPCHILLRSIAAAHSCSARSEHKIFTTLDHNRRVMRPILTPAALQKSTQKLANAGEYAAQHELPLSIARLSWWIARARGRGVFLLAMDA